MGTVIFTLGVLLVGLAALALPVLVVAARVALVEPEAREVEARPARPDHGDEARALGFVQDGPGRWVRNQAGGPPMVLEGYDDGDALPYVQRIWVDGGWDGVSVAPGRRSSTPTGDAAFDAGHAVEGEALHWLDDAVRAAMGADVGATLSLAHGRAIAAPNPDATLSTVVAALDALRVALDAAPVSDAELALAVGQHGGVRAEALRRCRDEETARELLRDAEPAVRLEAALLVERGALRRLALDPQAPAAVRHRAAMALPERDDAVLEAFVASDAPQLWSVAAKAERPAARRVALLRPLLRPGALDAGAWPEDPRVPHVGAKLGMALAEAPPPDAEALLVQLLAMPDARVRLQAVRGLRTVETVGALEALAASVEDPDPRVRREAREAVGSLRGTVRGGVSLAPASDGQGGLSVAEEGGAVGVVDEASS